MTTVLFGAIALVTAAAAAGDVAVSARIPAGQITAGQSYEFELTVDLPAGVSADQAGIPGLILQMEVPEGVRLQGPAVESHKDHAKNNFLRAPYEQMLTEPTTRIGFEVLDAPGPGTAFHLNVIGYLSDAEGEDVHFFRERLRLPVSAEAASQRVKAAESSWGKNTGLEIGDAAEDFDLPRADGSKLRLADLRGKNVIVTTYRAHW